MIRPSLLVLAEDCTYAVTLAERFPESSVVAKSGSAWHGRMSNRINTGVSAPDLDSILATLPAYTKIEAEIPAKLEDPDSGVVLTEGTADCVLTHEDGSITVIDWKTGNPDKVPWPSENLQVLAYGVSLAIARGAPRFRPGLYFTNHPPLQLGEWIEDGNGYWALVNKIREIVSRPRNEPSPGGHCDRCYRIMHCEARTLPAAMAAVGKGELAPYTTGAGLVPDKMEEADALRRVLEKMAEYIHAQQKALLSQHGPIVSGGKRFELKATRGREYIDRAAAEAAGLGPALEAAGAIKRARPSESIARSNASGRGNKAKGLASDWLGNK